MAKVKHPLMSIGASGSIGRAITFTKSRGVAICKGFSVSLDRESEEQLILRGVYSSGVVVWNGLSQPQKDVWNDSASGKKVTGFNLFMKNYMNNNYPPIEIGEYDVSEYGNCKYSV